MAADLDALRAAVVADPADDAARAVLGDALAEAGDPRGELYAVQLALARAGIPDSATLARSAIATEDPRFGALVALLRRERELFVALDLARRAPHDARAYSTVRRRFERGGQIWAELTFRTNAELAAWLAAEPIERLVIGDRAVARADELGDVAGIARITELVVRGPRVDAGKLRGLLRALPRLRALVLADADLDSAILVDCASLHSLVACRLEPHHLDDLAVSPHARTLARLALHEPAPGWDPLDALDGRFPHLADFLLRVGDSSAVRIEPGRRRMLPAALHLKIPRRAGRAVLGALVERAGFAGVRTLALPGLAADAGPLLAPLAAQARDLVELDLSYARCASADIAALAGFVPLARLAVSHDGPLADLVPAIRALAPRTLHLNHGEAAEVAQVVAAALPRVRDLAVRAPVALGAAPSIVRLGAFAGAGHQALPNLVDFVSTVAPMTPLLDPES